MKERSPVANIPEKLIQGTILEYLRRRGYVCKRNNAGMAKATYKGRDRYFRVGEAGWPDIEGITDYKHKRGSGFYFGIEVKSAKGRLAESQEEMGRRILKTGGIWIMARSLDDVIAEGF